VVAENDNKVDAFKHLFPSGFISGFGAPKVSETITDLQAANLFSGNTFS
jgi:hypothetical protein